MLKHSKLPLRLLIPIFLVASLAIAWLIMPVHAQEGDEGPETVALVGSLQSVLGCDGDWMPECEATALTYDPDDDAWVGTFDLPAGSYQYKVALNGSWDENYGAGAVRDGDNIDLVLEEETSVTFIYDHNTHWIAEDVNAVIATAAGDFQSEIGCPGDWNTDCLRTWLQDPDGDGIYEFSTTAIPAGEWQGKVALNQTWDVNYGLDGVQDGDNIPFSVPADNHLVTIAYDTADNMVTITVSDAPVAEEEEVEVVQVEIEQPDSVTIAGTVQGLMGCSGDWDPSCEDSMLTFDEEDGLWIGTWDLTAGSYEYKAALNGDWEPENYGLNAEEHGPNIPLVLEEDTTVTFIYDHRTHWITDSVNSIIANVPSNFQAEVGCPGNWAPDCLRTWLQDPDGDGIYEYSTTAIPAGDWEAKVAVDQTWDISYGEGGALGAGNIAFTVAEAGQLVTVTFDPVTPMVEIIVSDAPVEMTEAEAAAEPQPESVTLVGTVQSALGCEGDWDPACEATFLAYDGDDGVWQGTWRLPAGDYEYKVALNGTWDEDYGAGAARGGDNITLSVPEEMKVTFIYDHDTHWIADDINATIAVAVGDFQDEIGCPGDWQPDCLQSWLQDPDGDGIYTYTGANIPGGEWKLKVAIDQGIRENYGMDGEPGGQYMLFTVPDLGYEVTISYDAETHIYEVAVSDEPVATPEEVEAEMEAEAEVEVVAGAGLPEDLQSLVPEVVMTEPPNTVTIAGTVQDELGCDNDWDPSCEATFLTYDAADDLWWATWTLPAGSYEYKAALNGSWEPENYGLNAEEHGPNIPLELAEETTVTFFYNHRTHWVGDSVNSIIANVPGSFQSELGCPAEISTGDWEPPCLRTLLEDPDGDGIYVFYTNSIPPGDYELKVAVNQSWDENYGMDGAPGGANIAFTIPAEGHQLVVAYNRADNMVQIDVSAEPVDRPIYAPPVVVSAGNIRTLRAYWVLGDTIAWNVSYEEGMVVQLHYSPTAELALEETGVVGGEAITLTYYEAGLPEDVIAKFPHLTGQTAFRISEDDLALVPDILRGQFALSLTDSEGSLLDATGLQIPGVLDDLYTYDGDLGVTWDGDVPTIRVWAPTAQTVRLHLFADSDPATEAT
ncbi:MAG: hypothetical protein GYB65_21345, partial [Chloroflexi bacterium]|nr:hypothetical protein [Chloroflexota bacterium]